MKTTRVSESPGEVRADSVQRFGRQSGGGLTEGGGRDGVVIAEQGVDEAAVIESPAPVRSTTSSLILVSVVMVARPLSAAAE